MKKILLLCLLQSNFMHAMETQPNYLNMLPDPIITNVMYQLVAVEDNNIKWDLNGCFFSDGFQAPDKKDDILQIKNIKNFVMTCKRHNAIVKKLLEDKSDEFFDHILTSLSAKFSRFYPFSDIDENYSLNKDVSNELYIAAHLPWRASLTWMKKFLKKTHKSINISIIGSSQDKKSLEKITEALKPTIMHELIGLSFSRALKPLKDRLQFAEEFKENIELLPHVIKNPCTHKMDFNSIEKHDIDFEKYYDVYKMYLFSKNILKPYPHEIKKLLLSYILEHHDTSVFEYCVKIPKKE